MAAAVLIAAGPFEPGVTQFDGSVGRMHALGTETAFEVVNKVKALEAQGKNIVHLHIGAPDFRTPENIVEAGRKALADGFHGYTPAKGLLPVRESVARYCMRFHKAKHVSPDDVLIVPGGKPTMFFAIMLFGEPGAETGPAHGGLSGRFCSR